MSEIASTPPAPGRVVSPPQVSGAIRHDLVLEDTTLRDGEQMPGVAFSKQTKLALHDLLVAAGVRWLEVGAAAMGGEELDYMRAQIAHGSDATLVAWSRAIRADVDQSLDLGYRAVHIGFPVSRILLQASVGRDRHWLLTRLRELVGHAKDRGAFVSVSSGDSARVEDDFLLEYAGVAREAGADRLRISDTTGALTPEAYYRKVGRLAVACDIDLHCHTHNDFGFATANTIAGLHAGARYFHVTVNGIGERAGNADLAQTAVALKHLHGRDVGIVERKLPALSAAVARASGYRVQAHHPIVGKNVFTHESGIHVNAMLSDTKTFEPILAPSKVGRRRRYVLGKHSGRRLLREMLRRRGIEAGEDELIHCLREVKALAVAKRGSVSERELLEIYGQPAGTSATSAEPVAENAELAAEHRPAQAASESDE
ncbi:MAG: hypothetical protein AAF481_12210 [Acidobacteriota bacterium]